LGFLGFFEVGISRQSPHPGSGRIDVRHGSGQRPQGQASVDDEHEKEKPSVGSGRSVRRLSSRSPILIRTAFRAAYGRRIADRAGMALVSWEFTRWG
jgi:hypothetical protein